MWYDRDIDSVMQRTMNRPLPAGRLRPRRGAAARRDPRHRLGGGDGAAGQCHRAALLALTIAYYVFVYTVWLKRRTPQNIVIGGASGAFRR